MRQRAHGFTLLEVIAAIAILALSSAALLQALGASMELTHKAASHTQAAAWAQSLLDSRFAMKPPRPGVTHGRFDKTYHWQLTVTPWQPSPTGNQPTTRGAPATPGHGLRLYKLDLAVMWGPARREQVAHFDTLRVVRARPAESTP
jgi:general secretion pathway protein I